MRNRRLAHVAGPSGSGKTAFIEHLLEADLGIVTCVRGVQESGLHKVQESRPAKDGELRRYARAGAITSIRYLFGKPDGDEFFVSNVMQEYSEAVVIEGDCPIEWGTDLPVFVAPVPAAGRRLLSRTGSSPATGSGDAAWDEILRALESPEGIIRLFKAQLGLPGLAGVIKNREQVEAIRESKKEQIERERSKRPSRQQQNKKKTWSLAEPYRGIQHARLVIVNVRSAAERKRGEKLLEDIGRLRSDEEVFRDVVGSRGSRTRITAVAADLSNPEDPGLKKAVARVRRALQDQSV